MPAATNAGLDPHAATHLLVANLETRGASDVRTPLLIGSESRFGMNAGATLASTVGPRERLQIA